MTVGRARIGCLTILALVALRLAVGWHFFSEGAKKLAYDPATGAYRVAFSAEPFLVGATGPLADTMHDFAPGPHEWRDRLEQPLPNVPLGDEEGTRREQWAYEYAQRRAQAEKSGATLPIEFPDFAPYADWADKIVDDWQDMLARFVRMHDLDDQQRDQASAILLQRHQQLADYLEDESEAIADYRHELWRLEQLQTSELAGEVPFQDERIATMSSQLAAQPLAWVAQVNEFERHFENDLRGLLAADQVSEDASQESLNEAFADPSTGRLNRLNLSVTCLTIGVGLCLLLGFFTRLASLAGMVFLIGVMASQPPWVSGARLEYFYYQLVECASLLVLLVVGAGRWLGLDYFSYALWNRIVGRTDDDD